MNRLRELLEHYAANDMVCFALDALDGESMKAYIQHESTRRWVNDCAEKSMCFYMGEAFEVEALKFIPSLFRLPYQYCYFELQSEVGLSGILCEQRDDGKILMTAFGRKDGTWGFLSAGYAFVHSDKEIGCVSAVGTTLDDSESLGAYASDVARFVSALHCGNIVRVEHKQPEKLQKARSARGKKPLFSFWTLEIKQDRTEGDHLGGTHASPRLHLRRGHPRQYAPGKWTWVQPCAVGNKAIGMVHKDYRLAGLPHNEKVQGQDEAQLRTVPLERPVGRKE